MSNGYLIIKIRFMGHHVGWTREQSMESCLLSGNYFSSLTFDRIIFT